MSIPTTVGSGWLQPSAPTIERQIKASATVQRLLDGHSLVRGSQTALLVFDHRLLGLGSDGDSGAVSIFTAVSNASFRDDGHQPSWRLASEFTSNLKDMFATVALLGGRASSGTLKPLVLLFDAGNVDVAALCRQAEVVEMLFSSIDVCVCASQGDKAYADALLRAYVNETAIVLRGSQRDTPIMWERWDARVGFKPSPLGAARFATSMGQFFKQIVLVEEAATDDQVVSLRFSLTAQCPEGPPSESRPLFTVLTRTQGRRMHTLREVFCCLAAQSCVDFEHIVVGHNLEDMARHRLKALVAEQPPALRARIRLCPVDGGNRTLPLNHGFGLARGLYTVILDDDDIVFAHWLDTFRELAVNAPGQLLRATAVRQEFEQVTVNGHPATRAISGMINEYGGDYDHISHLTGNRTPPVSIAFPTFLFAENGFRFDEKLTTTEDWDYIIRCAGVVGVSSSDEITSIYRWWINAESSRTEHDGAEWHANHAAIQEKIAGRPYLIPGAGAKSAQEVGVKAGEYFRWAQDLNQRLETAMSELSAMRSSPRRLRVATSDPLDVAPAYKVARTRFNAHGSRLNRIMRAPRKGVSVTSLEGVAPGVSAGSLEEVNVDIDRADWTASALTGALLEWADILALGGTLDLSLPMREAGEDLLDPATPDSLRIWLISSGLYPEFLAMRDGRLVARALKISAWSAVLPGPDNDRAFLEWAYWTILGREIDSYGAEHYGNDLQQGLTRRQLLKTLWSSGERGAYVARHYPVHWAP